MKKDPKRTKKTQKGPKKGPKKDQKYLKLFYTYIYNMNKYTCECCNFRTNNKTKYERHTQTKKHKLMYPKCIQMYPNVSKKDQNVSIMKNDQIICSDKLFTCKYCNKAYKYSQGLSKHIKFTCKKNKDEDLKELVRLMNEKMEKQTDEINIMKTEIERRDKQITKLSTKLQINNNCNIINNQINNIQLLNYKDTDISHLQSYHYINCLKRVNNGIKTMIENIHYNPDKPENMNIYISNLKNRYVMVYENDKWELRDYFDNIYEHKEMLLEEWIANEKDKYPELIEKFKNYLNNKENNSMYNKIKEDIKLMMYNNRLFIHKKLLANN